MSPKLLVLPFLLMMTLDSAFALDIEKHENADQEQVGENEKNTCGVWKGIKSGGHWFFDKLGTPKGATVLAVTYALEQAVGNFLWGFNWAENANASTEAHMIVQETGAMLVVAGCVIAGVLIPSAVLSYQKKHPAENSGN